MPYNPACIGIDKGIIDRLALSSGQPILSIEGQGIPRDAADYTVRRRVHQDRPDIVKKQQRLSRCRKGSRRWKQRAAVLANAQARRRVRNRNECHRTTTEIVRQYGHIAVESLQLKNMTGSAAGTLENPGRNVSAKSGLNREILEQTWGLIHQQLRYKAEWAGRRFVEVDPRHTSQTCNSCGTVNSASRQRKVFLCIACSFSLDADLNAARNILRKSLAGGESLLLAQ